MLGISRKHSSLAVDRKPVLSIDQGVQTDGQGEDTHINLEITLPLPAPPPRLNRGGANQPEIHKPVSPDLGKVVAMGMNTTLITSIAHSWFRNLALCKHSLVLLQAICLIFVG